MTIKICAAITAKTMRELETMVDKAEKEGASMLEIRLDYLERSYNVKYIRRLTALPLIATNRLPEEGGLFKGKEDKRINSMLDAASNDFDFIDIELVTRDVKEAIDKIRGTGAKLIVSKHDFSSTPNMRTLNKIFREESTLGADVCKIVTTATKTEDNLTCLQFVSKASKQRDAICFSMGQLGMPSRLLSPIFGGFLTYASIDKGRESAPGQLTIAEMQDFYELMKYDC